MQLFYVVAETNKAEGLKFGPFSKRETAEQLVIELARRVDVVSAEIGETKQPVQD